MGGSCGQVKCSTQNSLDTIELESDIRIADIKYCSKTGAKRCLQFFWRNIVFGGRSNVLYKSQCNCSNL